LHFFTAEKLAYPLLGYVFFFLIHTFFPSNLWLILMNAVILLVLLTSFHRTKPSYQLISGSLIVTGLYLLISNHATSSDWLQATMPNAGISCLLITVPLLGITLFFEPYLECLQEVMPRYIKTPFHFYTVTALFSNFLASLLNVAAIPFLYQLFAGVAAKYSPRMFYHAMSRGIAPNLMWSPSYISVAVATQYMNLSWQELLPLGLLMAAIGLFLALLLGRLELLVQPIPECRNTPSEAESLDRKNIKYLYKLAAQMLLMIGLILLLDLLTHKSALVTVPLLSLVAPFLMAVLLRRTVIFKSNFHTYFTVQLPKMYNQLILFSAISIFGSGLAMSEIRQWIPDVIHHLGFASPLAVIPLLITMVGGPGLLGIHPIVSISAIAVAISPQIIGLSQMQMTGALLTGYMTYTILSPFSGTTMVLAAVAKTSSLDMSLKLNIPYGLLFVLMNTLVLTWFM
jgi:hypothetical protein